MRKKLLVLTFILLATPPVVWLPRHNGLRRQNPDGSALEVVLNAKLSSSPALQIG